MRRRTLTTALLTLAALAACRTPGSGSGSGPGSGHRLVTAEGVARESYAGPEPGPPVANLQPGLAAFGHALLSAVAEPRANTVLSPLGIAYAYGMARAGADPATGAGLDEVFGFPPEGPHAAFGTLSRVIATTGEAPPVPAPAPDRETPRDARQDPAPPVVHLAGGLFTAGDLAVRQEFLRVLAAHYGTGAHQVDFAADAVEVINAWAGERTAGRITKVFDLLDPATRLVLASALHLKAEWAVPFTDPPEPGAVFTRADGTAVRTDLMRLETELPYASGPGWQAAELAYAGGGLAMWVLLPAPGGSPARLLAPEALTRVRDGLERTRVRLALPRWDFSTALELGPALEGLGLRSSGYPGISDGLVLDRAVHGANITVDEWGTEAAAVTGLAFRLSAPPPAEAELRADRPFAFAVVHRPTLVPLFIGQVADPAATG
ncbi:serpin family protein [Planomonospora corallina]|uniref:Serpin family protein n=1 Tax=Planomonospora corallina TaxID=1806052 RepID=A0ABV8IDC1_9ACTN